METTQAREQPGTTYLVERYWPGIDETLLVLALERLLRATADLTLAGTPVSHLGSVLVGDEQVVYSLIHAGSEGVVRDANALAQLPVDRISTSTLHGFAPLAQV